MTSHDNELLHANTHRHTYQSLIPVYIPLCSRCAVDSGAHPARRPVAEMFFSSLSSAWWAGCIELVFVHFVLILEAFIFIGDRRETLCLYLGTRLGEMKSIFMPHFKRFLPKERDDG